MNKFVLIPSECNMFQTGLNGKILIFISVLEAREGLSLVGALIEMDDIQLFNEKPLHSGNFLSSSAILPICRSKA